MCQIGCHRPPGLDLNLGAPAVVDPGQREVRMVTLAAGPAVSCYVQLTLRIVLVLLVQESHLNELKLTRPFQFPRDDVII